MNTAATPRTRANNRSISSSSSSSSSFSSSSSSFNFSDDPSSLSPSTPFQLSGVPFSWEKLPGIPKTRRRNSTDVVSAKVTAFLPPPPPGKQSKLSSSEAAVAQWDPFVAALVECSRDEKRGGYRDDHDREGRKVNSWGGAKVSRSISDRFGSVSMYGSCKRVSAVSESIIIAAGSTGRPRSYGHRRSVDKLSL